MNAQQRIDRARWWAVSEQTFYGALAMHLADVIDPNVQTAETDGKVIRWNPEYVDGLSDPKLRFLLLHETLHCAHQHPWRLPCDALGNEAGDQEINNTLVGIPGTEPYDGALCDPQYKDLACEEILKLLRDKQRSDQHGDQDQDQDQGQGQDQGTPGSFTQPADEHVPGPSQLKEDWATAVVQANQASQASGCGDIPGDMKRELERLRAQYVDWKRELADFVRQSVGTRNDWSRCARRYAWQPVIYPRKRQDNVGVVVFARDTSGSVTSKQCSEFSALVTDCMLEVGCHGIVLDCDTRIRAEHELSPGEVCPVEAEGGGGTRFQPVFDRARQLQDEGIQVAGIVYLTDLEGPMPEPTDIPTLWLVNSDKQAPFGRSVKVEM